MTLFKKVKMSSELGQLHNDLVFEDAWNSQHCKLIERGEPLVQRCQNLLRSFHSNSQLIPSDGMLFHIRDRTLNNLELDLIHLAQAKK